MPVVASGCMVLWKLGMVGCSVVPPAITKFGAITPYWRSEFTSRLGIFHCAWLSLPDLKYVGNMIYVNSCGPCPPVVPPPDPREASGNVLLRASVPKHLGVAQGQFPMPVMASPKNGHAQPLTPRLHLLPGCVIASGPKRLEVLPRTFTLGS